MFFLFLAHNYQPYNSRKSIYINHPVVSPVAQSSVLFPTQTILSSLTSQLIISFPGVQHIFFTESLMTLLNDFESASNSFTFPWHAANCELTIFFSPITPLFSLSHEAI